MGYGLLTSNFPALRTLRLFQNFRKIGKIRKVDVKNS